MNDLMQYVLDNFPDLFEVRKDYPIYLCKALRTIYDGPVKFYYKTATVDIVAHDSHLDVCFIFRLVLPHSSLSGGDKKIHLADDINLSDEQCLIFFNYDIAISTRTDSIGGKGRVYDRQAIMRRHTIKNIIEHD